MNFLHAFILGIIQGLTEFIPVSSTAHLLLGQTLLGLPSDDRMFSFQVIVQMGTVLALLVFFWRDFYHIIKSFLLGIWHRKPFENHDSQLGWLVIIATIPALIVGFLLKDVVENMFKDPPLQAGIRLMMSAILLASVEYFARHERKLETATWLDALSVGLFQILALFPGASRSGSTIAGGMARGFDRPSAARFAFIMSAPILLAAGGYEMLNVIAMTGKRVFLPFLATGFITAALVGWFSLKWLLSYLNGHSFYFFALYCFVIGSIALLSQLF
jgi:undecaprenyl-diphosphatase